jgi:hypothetical protein
MSEFEFKVIVHYNSITAIAPNGMKTDGKVKRDPLTLDTMRIFKDWLNKGKLEYFEEFAVLGKNLYEAIFSDLGDLFKSFYKKAQEEQKKKIREERKPLVVQLGFEVNDELANWPWEYLYSPDETSFLVTYLDIVVSRYVAHNKVINRLPPENSPLRVLVVNSCIEDEHLTGARQTYKDIHSLVDQDLPIDPHLLEPSTLNNFLDELEQRPPHVLHFIGYNRLKDKGGETEIGLLNGDDEKSIHWMSGKEFIGHCTRGNKTGMPRLVFLHLRETTNHDIARLAFQLSEMANIPVVATHHPIDDIVAKRFCIAFYRALANGQSIPAAVQDGRKQIVKHVYVSKAYRDLGAIVLYTRDADVSIIRSAKDTYRKRRILGNTANIM